MDALSLEGGIAQFLHPVFQLLHPFPLPPLQCSLTLRGSGVNILFRAESTTVGYSQYLGLQREASVIRVKGSFCLLAWIEFRGQAYTMYMIINQN